MTVDLSALSVSALLAAFRSAEPSPGGGAASALAGAVGAALLAMVARLATPRAVTAEDLGRLAAAGARCAALSDQFASLMSRDTDAYTRAVSAYRLPKRTDDEQRVRAAVIQDALQAAVHGLLEVMRAGVDAIEQGAVVATFGTSHAGSDLRVGLELLGVGIDGAKLSLDVNVGSLTDAAFASSADHEARRLASAAHAGIAAAGVRLAAG
jgi:formiminotetrahydrofolate cyclodeaminase